MTLEKLALVLSILRTELGKKDIPLQWVELFLLVSAAGPKGALTKDVSERIDMAQAIASRTVKLLSSYLDKDTRQLVGMDVFTTRPDHEYLHRQRVILTPKGEKIANKIKQLLK